MSILDQLSSFDPCDREELLREVQDTLKDFKVEVKDTINNLSAQSLGSFAVTMAALLAQMAQGVLMNFTAFVASAVIGNIVGGITTLAGLAVSLVTGAEIMLKYLASTQLAEALDSRIELSKSLDTEMGEVIKLLQALNNLESSTGEILLYNIDEAYPHVKEAHRRVGIEYSKVEGIGNLELVDNPINSSSLKRANDNIDQAMQFLIGDKTVNPAFKKALKKINGKYRLGAATRMGEELIGASVASPIAVLEYFKEASQNIADNYSEGGRVSQKGRDRLRNFLVDFVQSPGINQFFKNYASMRFLGSHMQSLGRHLPITAVVMRDIAEEAASNISGESLDPLAVFKRQAKEALDDTFNYLSIHSGGSTVEYESEDVTLGGKSLAVRTCQTAVIMMDRWIEIVNYEVGGLKLFLDPANQNLEDVQKGMKRVIDNQELYNTNDKKRELLQEKMEWMRKLSAAKSLISSSIEGTVQFAGGGQATPENINNQFRESLELFETLQTTILNRTVKELPSGEIEEIPRESDEILSKADKYLKSFVLGNIAIFDSRSRVSLLSQLQSMRFLLKDMVEKDKDELSRANDFIRSVERNPLFSSTILPAWQQMIKGLKDSPVGEFISEDLANGDLSTLVNGLTNAGYGAQKLLKIFDCSDAADDFNSDAIAQIITGGSRDKLSKVKKLTERADETISQLRNKKAIIDGVMQEAQDKIAQA